MPDIESTAPSRFRRQHGRIVRAERQTADSRGEIGAPYQAEGLLGQLERRGAITPHQRHAGEEFSRLFRLAHLDPLKAADMVRAPGGDLGVNGIERARRRIDDALKALGGPASPCGSCAWFVLGVELSLAEWARREGWQGRSIRQEVAKGTLIGALGVLARHFGT